MKNIFKKDQSETVDGMGTKADMKISRRSLDDGSSFSTPTKSMTRKKAKSSPTNPIKKAFRNMKGRGGPNAHCRPPTGTPPITPSPTKGESQNNLKVQILSSPSNDPMNVINANTMGVGMGVDTTSTMSSPNDYESERAISSEASSSCEETSLLQTVFGMSCGETVFDMDMNAAVQRLGLSTIPEDERINEWGTAPDLSDGEESDEYFDGIGSAQDYYEMVLREDDEESDFCMPCNDGGDSFGNSDVYGTGENQTVNVILRRDSSEDVFEMDGGTELRERSKESKNDGGDPRGLRDRLARGKIERSLSANSQDSEGSNDETKKKRIFKFSRKHSSKKVQSPSRGDETPSDAKSSPSRKNLSKMLPKRFHKKKNKNGAVAQSTSIVIQPPPTQKPKRPRWKCVHDSKTGRTYFYHSVTRQVTWDRPKGFIEWRVATLAPKSNIALNDEGKKSGKRFFYNVITKETRWDVPKGFVQWKEVWDERSQKCYYYNILTRKTTWNRPEGLVMDRNGEVAQENVLIIDSVEKENDTATEDTTGVPRSHAADSNTKVDAQKENDDQNYEGKATPTRGRSSQKLVGTNSMSNMKVRLGVEKSEPDIPIRPIREGDDHHVVYRKRHEQSEKKETVRIEENDENHSRLAKLLSDYCPDEKENNSQLLKLARGQETPIIMAIQTLVEDTPFDELRLVIFSYVKATVVEMGEEPYDEKRRRNPRPPKYGPRPPITKYGSHLMKRAETYDTSSAPSAAYSMNSRAISHMTGNSGSTMPVNNKSKRTGTKILRHINNFDRRMGNDERNNKFLGETENSCADESVDDIDTDESQENVKVVLDMKIVGDGQGEVTRRDILHFKEEILASKSDDSEQKLKHRSTSSGENLEMQSSSSSSLHLESVNDETIESAYAGDCDDETDLGAWEEEDDVSALSDDCFSLERSLRSEKKITSKREEFYRKEVVSF